MVFGLICFSGIDCPLDDSGNSNNKDVGNCVGILINETVFASNFTNESIIFLEPCFFLRSGFPYNNKR